MKTKPCLMSLIVLVATLSAQATPTTPRDITVLGTPVTENFDTLSFSGTSSLVPFGWEFNESGSGANTVYTAGTGSSTTGDTYSFGASTSTERAFGGLQSGSLVPKLGVGFQNASGGLITSLLISYTGEEWRLGTASRADRLDFQYSVNATSLTDGTWTDFDALDFSTPNTGTAGLKDGNASENRTALSSSIGSLSIAQGDSFWLRWTDFNVSGSDDGLAIDDFSLTAEGVMPTAPDTGSTAILLGIPLLSVLALRRQFQLAF